MTTQELLTLAQQVGFDHAGPLDPATLDFNPAVRDMCAADRCHSYGRCWTCPPACGTLEEMAAQAALYRRGVLLQSTGALEDDFDVDTMLATEALQKERFHTFVAQVRRAQPDCMPMSSGACSVCPTCTYPDAPCRAPALAIPSMEACGLVVSQVCQQAGLPYYYGPKTITYTACVLLDKTGGHNA